MSSLQRAQHSDLEHRPPLADITQEAIRIVDSATESVSLRVTGGVGIALRCESAAAPGLQRRYADIDLVGRVKQRREIAETLCCLGYTAAERFNALQGATRLLFWDTRNERQVDVFLDRVEMCHRIELADRLALDAPTLSLADLLLLNLQIVETNHKDLVDAVTLLTDHPFTTDENGIKLDYLAGLGANDWGLWQTTTTIATRVADFAGGIRTLEGRFEVHEQTRRFLEAMEKSEKTSCWRLRARLGMRKRWYDLPEESTDPAEHADEARSRVLLGGVDLRRLLGTSCEYPSVIGLARDGRRPRQPDSCRVAERWSPTLS